MKLLTLGFLLLYAGYGTQPAYAQSAGVGDAPPKDIVFGVKGGVSFTNVVAGGGAGEGRTGLNAGVFLRTPLSPWSDLYAEAAYHQKGNYSFAGLPPTEEEPFGERVRTSLRYDLASLFVAGRAHSLFEGSNVILYGLLGPRVDVLIGQRFEATDRDFRFSELESMSDHTALVLGYGAGVGMDLSRVLPIPLLAEVRFNGDITEPWQGVRHRTIDLRVGVQF